jgi:hypothetical protein
MKNIITPETLRQIVSYDPMTGKLCWLVVKPEMFKPGKRHSAETRCAIWNSKYSGRPALQHRDKNRPYAYGDIFGRKYYAHRVAFAIMAGKWPKIIDHIDGDKSNNRWSNLREVTQAQNMQNTWLRADNTSGHVGVSFDVSRGLWSSEIYVNGKKQFLGRYVDKNEAIAARLDAQLLAGFSLRHGTKPEF